MSADVSTAAPVRKLHLAGSPATPGVFRAYETGGFLFRLDPARPNAPASVLRDGTWAPVPLTGDDVRGVLKARPVSPEEVERRIARVLLSQAA